MDILIPNNELEGFNVSLKLINVLDRNALLEVINDGSLWEIRETKVPKPDELEEFIHTALLSFRRNQEVPFVITEKGSNTVVGSTRLMNIQHNHRRLEVGYTFIAKSWQRTFVNLQTKYLLLEFAFESLLMQRVEFFTDVDNVSSQKALERVGAVREGILRRHMILREGKVRSSAVYSIIIDEWPKLKIYLNNKIMAGSSQ